MLLLLEIQNLIVLMSEFIILPSDTMLLQDTVEQNFMATGAFI